MLTFLKLLGLGTYHGGVIRSNLHSFVIILVSRFIALQIPLMLVNNR